MLFIFYQADALLCYQIHTVHSRQPTSPHLRIESFHYNNNSIVHQRTQCTCCYLFIFLNKCCDQPLDRLVTLQCVLLVFTHLLLKLTDLSVKVTNLLLARLQPKAGIRNQANKIMDAQCAKIGCSIST